MLQGTFLILLLVLGCSPAGAEPCVDQVRQLAATYGVSSDPPTAPSAKAPKPLSSEELARSGGVVEPPPTKDKSVITPPADSHYRMPTVPDVTPSPKKSEDTGPKGLSASDLTTLQSILVAARSQAERGMEGKCLEDLERARRLVHRPQ